MTLYAVSHRGGRYHSNPCCTGLNSFAVSTMLTIAVPAVTRAEAVRRGLQPCKTCRPSPLLAVVPTTTPEPT